MDVDPRSPIRADHRFIKKLVISTLEGKIEYVPEEFDLISRVFVQAGGSWERVFKGSPQDIRKLKKVLKTAFKKGFMTKKHKWGPK